MGDDGHDRGRVSALVLGGPHVARGTTQQGTRRVPAASARVPGCPGSGRQGVRQGARSPRSGRLAELDLEELLYVFLGSKLDFWQVCNLTQKLTKVILTFTFTLAPEGITPVVIFYGSNFTA